MNKRVLLLLSGGIDSPVAGAFARKAGYRVGVIHFTANPFYGSDSLKKAKKIALLLGFKPFFCCDIGFLLLKIASAETKEYFTLQKIIMYKIACLVALKINAFAIVTGESIGQVSSQTMASINVLNQSIGLPVFRPLLGFDKKEIMLFAEKIGSLRVSEGKETCDFLGPRKPSTNPNPEKIRELEEKLELEQELKKIAPKKLF